MNRTLESILTWALVIGFFFGVCFLYDQSYHINKAKCFANGGIWSERMSSGDDGFSWKCTYNPHTEVTIK